MFKKIILGSFLVCTATSPVIASNIEFENFFPQVTIDGNTSDAIEIRAKEFLFSTVYSTKDQRFFPLSIPFEVASLSGNDLNYRLSLPTSIHQCDLTGEFGVAVQLNGEEWPVSGSDFTGTLDSHVMNLTYDPVPQQEGISQSCFGTLKVQVEVVAL